MATKKKSKRAKRITKQQMLMNEWQSGYERGLVEGRKRLQAELRELLGVDETIDKAINIASGSCEHGCC